MKFARAARAHAGARPCAPTRMQRRSTSRQPPASSARFVRPPSAQFAHISAAVARHSRVASFHRASSGRHLAQHLAPHQRPSRVRLEQGGRWCTTDRATRRPPMCGQRAYTIMAIHIDQIQEKPGSDTTVVDPDPPPGQAAEEQFTENREAINTKNKLTFYDIHRMFSVLPRWHLCLAPTVITIIRLFSVDCGSLRQSGPRPDPRLLRQAPLEALTRSARTDSPRQVGRKPIFR
ncbi:hypothetical protein F511_46064 [Dorcoceras hygrometricum]|uniref:Uncharacterized protein n=1 Tax=Dorcoceras hygrometricum TaxID=472368 RepID=A0A2Z6ZVK4_9LAMI|nr:hypothetical protein F511_46064 [Dorcoceras hygrometricum]